MSTCVFCGGRDPASHKLLPRSYVTALLDRQRAVEVCEPVLELMCAQLAQLEETPASAGTEDEADAEEEPQVLSCMCCFYWVDRRISMRVTPLPMQNLLWFLRTLSWCESVCDSRVLQRLVETVAEPGNVFARVFHESELEGLLRIARELRGARSQARIEGKAKLQGAERFCVKRALARLWRAQNADCLFMPHAEAADWLR